MAIQTIPGSAITAGTITATQMSNTIQMGGPKISSIILTDSGYATITDTALGLSGGYIRILGTGFVTGCSVSINTVIATSVTFISSTEVRAQLPSMSAGTYIMYLSNSDGGVAIRVNALTYSSTPSWTSTSPLPGGLVNTAISIQLGATSDSTISYTVQAGSTLPTGLTLSSGGLLSGTVTGIALETTYNFTVVATDLESQISPKAFSITIIVSDPYFKSTVLLLNGDVTPFTADASTNKFEISAVGTPSANVNNPVQPGYYSGYFNGSTDYLTTPSANSALVEMGSGDYTVECWFNATASTDGGIVFKGQYQSGATWLSGFGIRRNSATNLLFYFNTSTTNAGEKVYSYTGTTLTNTWYHVAMVVRSGIGYAYLNGTLLNAGGFSGVGTISTSSTGISVGIFPYTVVNLYFPGYISNLRIVKGTAVYTGNFTPQTSSLTSTQSAGFLAATATPTVDYLIVAGGGGGGTDLDVGGGGGGGGLLTGTTQVALQQYIIVVGGGGPAGTGPDNTGTGGGTNGTQGINSSFATLVSIGGGYGGTRNNNGGTGGSGGGGGDITIGGGYGGSGTAGQGYAGGTSPVINSNSGNDTGGGGGAGGAASSTVPGPGLFNVIGNATFSAGGRGAQLITPAAGVPNTGNGGTGGRAGGSGIVVLRYLSSYSPASSTTGNPSVVVSGGYRIYTWTTSGTITFGDSNIAAITGTATSLLTCQSNRFIDNSSTPNTITASGTPSISVTQPFTLPSPYTGYGSAYFNAISDYLSYVPGSVDSFGTGDFTVECWVNPAATAVNICFASPTTNSWELLTYANQLYWHENGGNLGGAGYGNVPLKAWSHLAVSRFGTTLRIFINGIQVYTVTNSFNYSGVPTARTIGPSGGGSASVYISNFRIIKGTAVYTANFTPPTAPLTAITGTSLLTLQNNQAQNNNQFRDSSTNNFAVTRTGTPTQGTFTPFSQTGWSGYFNGTSALQTPASSITSIMGTNGLTTASVFTVECWMYSTARGSNNIVGDMIPTAGTSNWSFGPVSSGAIALYWYNGAGYNATGSTITPLNTWIHIALVINGTNIKIYVNGTLETLSGQTTSNGAATTTGYIAMGEWNNGGATYGYSGYVNNLRIVKGVVVYTGNFTPPIGPLTATQSAGTNIAAITGTATSLLTLQDNRFKDNSTNAFSFTATGTPSIQAFSPFAPSAAYSTTLVGGSMYFTNTNTINMPNSASSMGAGAFTVEAWVYPTAYPVTNSVFLGSGNNGFNLNIISSGLISSSVYGVATIITGSYVTPLNAWTHIAVTRSGSTWTLWVNGTSNGTGTSSATLIGSTVLGIGYDPANATQYFTGYISNVRIVNGTALYSATFTPPTAPLTAIAGTSLLLSATNAGIFDATSKNDIIVVNDARVSTSKQKYGSGAMYFDGTGDYLSMLAAPNLYFGAGDFTIEAWIWKSANGTGSGGYDGIFQLGVSGSVTDGCVLEASSARGYYFTMGGGWSLQYNVSPNDSTWHHVAVSRSGNNTRLFVDGVQQAIYTSAYTIPSTATYALVGAEAGASYPFNGYIDDLRITKGVGRYTTTFTPSTTALLGM